MGRKGWATKEQRVFLEPLISVFLEAQKAATTSDFFDQTFNDFKAKFPLPAPSKKQLNKAQGDQTKAAEAVKSFWKKVRKQSAISFNMRTHEFISACL